MSVYSEAVLGELWARRYFPYCLISKGGLQRLDGALRLFRLRATERVTLHAIDGGCYVSVLAGRIGAAAAGVGVQALDAESTRERPYRMKTLGANVELTALEDALVCCADAEALDYLVSWDGLAQLLAQGDRDIHARLEKVRQGLAFRRLPFECVEEAFRRMRLREVAAGEEVVRQGDTGDAFYVIAQGGAEVWQTGLDDDAPRCVARLCEGDAFGEEALVSRGTRNATVRMTEDGELWVLSKEDFQELVSRPMVQEVTPTIAKAMLESGARLLDVRYAEEHAEGHIPGATLIPLFELRARIGELDPGAQYVVYCRSGKRSAVGTLLLGQRRVNAVSLKGGINEWPYALSEAQAG